MSQPIYVTRTQLELWKDLFATEKISPLIREAVTAYPDSRSVVVSFRDLVEFNTEFAEHILAEPDTSLSNANDALREMATPFSDIYMSFKLRLIELPQSARIPIRELRSVHVGKFVSIHGLLRKVTEVRPKLVIGAFKCVCGHIQKIRQHTEALSEPFECSENEGGCGRKGSNSKFTLLFEQSFFIDSQKIEIQESPDNLQGGAQPQRITGYIREDIAGEVAPGDNVILNGILEARERRQGSIKSTVFDIVLDVNSVEQEEEKTEDLEISDLDLLEIETLAKNKNIYSMMINSVAPTIYGMEHIKEALILQLFGGVKKRVANSTTRGDIHVLLIGDPGTAKSQLLRFVSELSVRGIYTSGQSATKAGLTATAVKDDFGEGRWTLEAGALVLADKGIACTTADTRFITEDYRSMSFEELFRDTKDAIIHPDFRVLGLDTRTNTIRPFRIKQAFRKKNEQKIYRLTTRTGRELKLTPDNELLVVENSKELWKEVQDLKSGDFIAVPARLPVLSTTDDYSHDFAYVAGLIASDGHIKMDRKNAQTSFYNSNPELVELFCQKLHGLGIKYNRYVRPKGKTSVIRGKIVQTKKDSVMIYNSRKAFAQKLIEFGIPAGNKSKRYSLSSGILSYSNETLALFMRGIFDGDGSVRANPVQVTIITGLLENANFFQNVLARLDIVSSVKKSQGAWHCDVRGAAECEKFRRTVGSNHPEKAKALAAQKTMEFKDRINVLPNHQEFFMDLKETYRGKLGKDVYKYIWNYSREGVCPSKRKLTTLNRHIGDTALERKISDDILWDRIVSVESVEADHVYDFTMEGTNNFLANNIIMHNCVDELDKMNKEDRSSMHEALEQQRISIAKAGITATLQCRCSLLAAANPKAGRFDPFHNIYEEINLPPPLLTRFDVIFPIQDKPERQRDNYLARHVIAVHTQGEMNAFKESRESLELEETLEDIGIKPIAEEEKTAPVIDRGLLKKYIAYAKKTVFPILTEDSRKYIIDYYVRIRNEARSSDESNKVPITARQLEAFIRLSEASAKIRLSSVVERQDVLRAIHVVKSYIEGLTNEKGYDMDAVEIGATHSQRDKIRFILEVMQKLSQETGHPRTPLKNIIDACTEQHIAAVDVKRLLDLMKGRNLIYESRNEYGAVNPY